MSIWFKEPNLADIRANNQNTMVEFLGIDIFEIGEDYIKGRMPVDTRTHQPYGILHGGASVTLAETLGSTGAHLVGDAESQLVVGLDINANHIRPTRSGMVTGTARPVHLGGSTQVWEIRIEDDKGRLTCISRLTMAILARSRFQGSGD